MSQSVVAFDAIPDNIFEQIGDLERRIGVLERTALTAEPDSGGGIDLTAVRGDLIYGDSTPAWARLAHPAGAGYALITDANDVAWDSTPTWAGVHTFDAGIVIGSAGDIVMPDDGWIGIGSGSERIVFDASGYISVMGARLGIGTLTASAELHIVDPTAYALIQNNNVGGTGYSHFRVSDHLSAYMFEVFQFGPSYPGIDVTGVPNAGLALFYTGAGTSNIAMRTYKSTASILFGAGTGVEDMRIDSTGRVGIQVTGPAGQLHVDQASTTGAIPVLILDQADVSEGFINFIGSNRGVITGATNSVRSVRVEYGGTVYRLALYADA